MEYHNIRLGISHTSGLLKISKNKMTWTSRSGQITHEIDAKEIKSIEWFNVDKKAKMMKVYFDEKQRTYLRFIGFEDENEIEINKICATNLGKELSPKAISVTGQNWGHFFLRAQELICRTNDKKILFAIPYYAIHQSVIQGKNELSFEFKYNSDEQKNLSKSNDQLCEMRIFIPDDAEGAVYEEFNEALIKKANLEQDKTQIIAWFDKITFKLPRGKYQIQFFPKTFLFRGDTFSYKIQYTQIKRLFVFRMPGNKMALLVSLNPPIRQGQTVYGYLIMEFPADENCSTKINATEEELKTKYTDRNGKQILNHELEGPTFDVLSRVFMALSKIKIITAKNFESTAGDYCIKTNYKANPGFLYPLEKAMFFIFKPSMYIRHSDIEQVEFARIEGANVKLFDLIIYIKKNKEKRVFSGIDKSEYGPLIKYFLDKPGIALIDRDLHKRRVEDLLSNRNTRTRKNIKASSKISDIPIDDDDEEGDDDYNGEADKGMSDDDDDEADDFDDEDMKLNDNNNNNNDNTINDDDDGDVVMA